MLNEYFWEKYLEAYDILNDAIPYQKLMDDLIRALEIKKRDLVLDAGSGTGNLCIRLKESGAKPLGFDYSIKAINVHRKKDQGANVYLGDLTNKLPFLDGVFDKIVSNNVLYTIEKNRRLEVIKEFYRVLKLNGKLVIANVHAGFNPVFIFLDHMRQSKENNRKLSTAIVIYKNSYRIAKMFYYSYYLIKGYKRGRCGFLEKDEQTKYLLAAGFKNITKSITYSSQSFMDTGIKKY